MIDSSGGPGVDWRGHPEETEPEKPRHARTCLTGKWGHGDVGSGLWKGQEA